jgi:hypothetical protein
VDIKKANLYGVFTGAIQFAYMHLMTEHLGGIGSPAEALSLFPETFFITRLVFTNLRDRPPTVDVKVVLHLFLLIEPEYAIVRGRCTAAIAGIALSLRSLTF